MDYKNNGRKYKSYDEDECGSIKKEKYNFDFEFDIDESNECFIKDMENTNSEECEEWEEVYEEGFKEGFKEGYEKAKREVIVYMKKNKCCIKCKPKYKLKSIKKNKRFMKCEDSCKLRGTNINKKIRKMIKCM